MVADINTLGTGSHPEEFTDVNGTLFFAATDDSHGDELWKSNGGPLGAGGTELVADINPVADTGSNLGRFVGTNGNVFFAADNGTDGYELWKSNGGALGSGTAMVADIAASDDGNPKGMADVGGTLFFEANNGTDGNELFKSNPPYTSASMVADINPTGNSGPFALTDVGGTLLFAADDGTHGMELWKSNGGPLGAGTAMVADINPALGVSSFPDPPALINVNGTLFFIAGDGTHGVELWRSNGGPLGAGGTSMVADINTAPNAGSIGEPSFATVGGTLFFAASDGSTGLELWRTAMEAASTLVTPSPPAATATGQRAAALKKCKKKRPSKRRAKCKSKAKRLPV
jgi:ELWxxDGT repeat protein